jgi:prepilin-type N-terminal cleavage/methylation domain-containing protein
MELPTLSGRRSGGGLTRRGFTLIEMMIVMAIIVILIAVAVPFHHPRQRDRAP